MLLRLKQKSLGRMRSPVSKFYKAIEVVLLTCTTLLGTGKACFLLIEHGRVASCEKDFAYFQNERPSLVVVYS